MIMIITVMVIGDTAGHVSHYYVINYGSLLGVMRPPIFLYINQIIRQCMTAENLTSLITISNSYIKMQTEENL